MSEDGVMTDFNSIAEIFDRHNGRPGGQICTKRVKTIEERRESVISLIDDNLKRYDDPTYVIPIKNGNTKAPDRLYDIQGAYAVVCLMSQPKEKRRHAIIRLAKEISYD